MLEQSMIIKDYELEIFLTNYNREKGLSDR